MGFRGTFVIAVLAWGLSGCASNADRKGEEGFIVPGAKGSRLPSSGSSSRDGRSGRDDASPLSSDDGTGGERSGPQTSALGSGREGARVDLKTVVYAHGPTALYRFNPTTKSLTTVAAFSGCSQVLDLAVNDRGEAYVTADAGLYRLDLQSAACTLVRASKDYPNSLSFVPKGTLDPQKEALVGYVGGDYVRIDADTGAMQKVGSLGGSYVSSGDVVAVIGGGAFLTARSEQCDLHDCLLEIDPRTGAMLQNYGTVNHSGVFGLAYWGGVLFGFDSGGGLFEIYQTATGLRTLDVKITAGVVGTGWWGGGSTTSVPTTSGLADFPIPLTPRS